MKVKILLWVVVFFGMIGNGCLSPSAPFFKPYPVVQKKLPNGMEIFLLEDPELPTVEIFLYIKGGSVFDPREKEGLASVAMQAIRNGGGGRGGGHEDPDKMDQVLETMGASLEMGASSEYHFASLALLKKDLGTGLDILFNLLKSPGLDPGRFQIVKERIRESLERIKEDPLSLGSREFPSLIYGEGSPWGRKATPQSVGRILLEDVVRFHQEFLHPDRVILAASGDFRTDDFAREIEKRTTDWSEAGKELPSLSPVPERFHQKMVVIPRKGLTQTTILMGHLGAKRDDPEKFALLVMNQILGGSGSLTSRLGEEIREKEGRAYGIWSDFGFGRDFGLFRAVAQTALDNTDWVVQKMKSMIEQMANHPDFSREEVERAKQSILRSLPFDFETRFAQVKERARFRLWGYPDNYLEIYQKGISSVSVKDLERVSKRYLHPDGVEVLLVTDEKELGRWKGAEVRRID